MMTRTIPLRSVRAALAFCADLSAIGYRQAPLSVLRREAAAGRAPVAVALDSSLIVRRAV